MKGLAILSAPRRLFDRRDRRFEGWDYRTILGPVRGSFAREHAVDGQNLQNQARNQREVDRALVFGVEVAQPIALDHNVDIFQTTAREERRVVPPDERRADLLRRFRQTRIADRAEP